MRCPHGNSNLTQGAEGKWVDAQNGGVGGRVLFGTALIGGLERSCPRCGDQICGSGPEPEEHSWVNELLSSCLGFIAVEASSPTARLGHFTLAEDLRVILLYSIIQTRQLLEFARW